MKKIKSVICFTLAAGVLFSINKFSSLGANNPYSYFAFQVYAWQNNHYSQYSQLRNTSSPYDFWWVDFKSTTEGAGNGHGNITTFWLTNSKDDQVSPDLDLAQGSHRGSSAYVEANNIRVYLSAENNNFSGSPYDISGEWTAKRSIK